MFELAIAALVVVVLTVVYFATRSLRLPAEDTPTEPELSPLAKQIHEQTERFRREREQRRHEIDAAQELAGDATGDLADMISAVRNGVAISELTIPKNPSANAKRRTNMPELDIESVMEMTVDGLCECVKEYIENAPEVVPDKPVLSLMVFPGDDAMRRVLESGKLTIIIEAGSKEDIAAGRICQQEVSAQR